MSLSNQKQTYEKPCIEGSARGKGGELIDGEGFFRGDEMKY